MSASVEESGEQLRFLLQIPATNLVLTLVGSLFLAGHADAQRALSVLRFSTELRW